MNAGDSSPFNSRAHTLEITTKMGAYINVSADPRFTCPRFDHSQSTCTRPCPEHQIPLLHFFFISCFTTCHLHNVHSKGPNSVPLARLIQEGSKCPTITTSNISVKVIHDFEKAAQNFFNNKDINEDKQVSKILDCFNDHWIADWVEVDHDCLIDMTFPNFMVELCCLYLQPLWEEMTQAKFLSLSQNMSSFWQFTVLVQKTNSLLKGTVSHKDPCAICEHIEGGMDQVLFKWGIKEKVDKIMHNDKVEELQLWMDKVKQIEDKMRSYREDTIWEFEAQSYAQRSTQCTRDNHLAGPFPSSHPASSSPAKRSYPPNLTDAEHTLLRENKGCFKCHHTFAGHRAFEGKCEAPTGINYILVTQAMIDMAKKTCCIWLNVSITATSIIQNELTQSSVPEVHPVAAIMPGIPNLVIYHSANKMTVLEGSDSSDDKVSDLNLKSISTFLESVEAVAEAPPKSETLKEISPLIVPHLFWRALASPLDSLPILFDCLLDNGSHSVLICKSLVTKLGLRWKKLQTAIETDLTMHFNENKTSVTFYDFVKLPLYNVSGKYHAKPVCAPVASNLCCPVLLGLPFLSHNHIVINHSNWTAIDKAQS